MSMDLRVPLLFPFSQEPRNRKDLRQTQTSVSRKIKTRLATVSDAATIPCGIIKCELVVLPSWHCLWNPDASDPRLCLLRNVRQ